MKTIVIITTKHIWEKAKKPGQFTESTMTQSLKEVGFIHCTSPDQTFDIIQRFVDFKEVILLLVDAGKVQSPIKFEPAPSGRPGLFPHIYGPLNTDAVYAVITLEKNENNEFITPKELIEAASKS